MTTASVPLSLLALVATYRLTVAYRKYMRFDRPLLTIAAAQAVVLLIVVNLLGAAALPLLR